MRCARAFLFFFSLSLSRDEADEGRSRTYPSRRTGAIVGSSPFVFFPLLPSFALGGELMSARAVPVHGVPQSYGRRVRFRAGADAVVRSPSSPPLLEPR